RRADLASVGGRELARTPRRRNRHASVGRARRATTGLDVAPARFGHRQCARQCRHRNGGRTAVVTMRRSDPRARRQHRRARRPARVERILVNSLGAAASSRGAALDIGLPVESVMKHVTLEDLGGLPDFSGGSAWINSAPLTPDQLKGKVVLVWFWTFQCYNCLN